MDYEKSCGYIVYKIGKNQIFYLILQSLKGEWGFPKGHVENNETEVETANRELFEETNLLVKYIPGFRAVTNYVMVEYGNKKKQVIYFVGKHLKNEIKCQESEVLDAKFVSYKEAQELLSFNETKTVLKEADLFIKSLSNEEE